MKTDKTQKRSLRQRRAYRKSLPLERRRKHYKPFRLRHIGLVLIALFVSVVSAFQIGVYYGKTQHENAPLQPPHNRPQILTLRSSYGFSFLFDNEYIEVTAKETAKETSDTGSIDVPIVDIRDNRPITFVSLQATDKSPPQEGAARLTIELNQNTSLFSAAKAALPDVLSDEHIAASLFEVKDDNEAFNVRMVSLRNEKLNGLDMIKRVYEYTPKSTALQHKAYSVQWVGLLAGKPFALHLQGLADETNIPTIFEPVFDSLTFAPVGGDVLGLSTGANFLGFGSAEAQTLADKYIIENVSPAVVKLYHATCGTLIVLGEAIGGESCQLNTGSAFFVSSDGYIATNGHVVTQTAEDVFVGIMLENPGVLASFLGGAGLSESQIENLDQNPSLLASLIAGIYDLPPESLRIENEQHTYFVAIGDDPLPTDSIHEIYQLRNRPATTTLVPAQLVDVDFSSKDLYVISAGQDAGFSSSDVALLKTDLPDTPFIQLYSGKVTQNMSISIIGFPSDADNQLTDNTTLSTSVTNGIISAIRHAAGSRYRLYQSDADASQGNSGGPVLSRNGQVLGLLTYRFKNDSEQDAAKSYIRAIEDVKALAGRNDVEFRYDGIAQNRWKSGLNHYASNRFSRALEDFQAVQDVFPAHRLVNDYIASAEQAIEEGRDVQESPMIFFAAGMFATFVLLGGFFLIMRHHGHHRIFKLQQNTGATTMVEDKQNTSNT